MSRYVEFSVILLLITVVASIPTVSNEFMDELLLDINPEPQKPFQPQSNSLWKNIFGIQDDSEMEDTSGVKELFSSSQLIAVPSASAKVGGIIRYTIGKRVGHDRLVAHGGGGKRWTVPQDVTLSLKYPTSGLGATVTYAEIVVNQSSSSGNAHVVAGGIGQRSLAIAIQARDTLWFSYTADIYGL